MCIIHENASNALSYCASNYVSRTYYRVNLDAGIQDKSTSISIVKISKRWDDADGDESDTHVEARDRRYSGLRLKIHVCVFHFFDNHLGLR